MTPTQHWIARSTHAAQASHEPRWSVHMLAPRRTWLRASLPGILPAAVVVTTVVVKAASVAAQLPSGHGGA